jgi:hypothetical protein
VVDGRTLLAAHSHAHGATAPVLPTPSPFLTSTRAVIGGNNNLFNWFRRTENLSAKLWRAPCRWRGCFGGAGVFSCVASMLAETRWAGRWPARMDSCCGRQGGILLRGCRPRHGPRSQSRVARIPVPGRRSLGRVL